MQEGGGEEEEGGGWGGKGQKAARELGRKCETHTPATRHIGMDDEADWSRRSSRFSNRLSSAEQ